VVFFLIIKKFFELKAHDSQKILNKSFFVKLLFVFRYRFAFFNILAITMIVFAINLMLGYNRF